MRFIHIEIAPILLFYRDNLWELADGAFHRIQAFDDNQDFLPRAMGAWLALGDGFADDVFEV
jgi:hypothetical protein